MPAGGASPSEAGAEGEQQGATTPVRPTTLRLYLRPRRPRPPQPTGTGPGLPAGQAAAATSAGETAPSAPRRAGPRRRPPRRRTATPAAASPDAEARAAEAPDRRPQRRGPQYRGAGERPAGETARAGQERGSSGRRGPEGRDRQQRSARGRGPGGPRAGRRDAPPRRVEQKLYALESVVDRGFDDVEDETADNGTRRVHWTIIKRSVADQKSGKAMPATYVLQRDGTDTEFPNLGAARAAANKTIVHPEKLTMSKAEHVAARKQ
jgi:hypothetical protein